MTETDMVAVPDEIRSEPLSKALAERYLAYALSTITQRALPDVRDGLKPVHRRLLYVMRRSETHLSPVSKCRIAVWYISECCRHSGFVHTDNRALQFPIAV